MGGEAMSDEWEQYLGAMADLVGLDSERQRRYAAADADFNNRANSFASETSVVEREWKQLSEQASRVQGNGNELMRRYRLPADSASDVTRDNAAAVLAEAEKTVSWCAQAERWIQAYQQRIRDTQASSPAPAPPTVTATPPAPPPAAKKSGCGVHALLMVLIFVSAVTVTAAKLMGAF